MSYIFLDELKIATSENNKQEEKINDLKSKNLNLEKTLGRKSLNLFKLITKIADVLAGYEREIQHMILDNKNTKNKSNAKNQILPIEKTKNVLIAEVSHASSLNSERFNPYNISDNQQVLLEQMKRPLKKQNEETCVVAENGLIIRSKSKNNGQQTPEERHMIEQLKEMRQENQTLYEDNQKCKKRVKQLNVVLKSNEEFIKMLQEEIVQVYKENKQLQGNQQNSHPSEIQKEHNENLPINYINTTLVLQPSVIDLTQKDPKDFGLGQTYIVNKKLYRKKLNGHDVYEKDSFVNEYSDILEPLKQEDRKRDVLQEIKPVGVSIEQKDDFSPDENGSKKRNKNENILDVYEQFSDGSSLPSYLKGANSKYSIS